jgi:hypothetical protein
MENELKTKPLDLFAQFDGMCWPKPSGDVADIGWKLRYGTLTESERLTAASVIDAYVHLFNLPQKKRNERMKKIKSLVRTAD